MVRWFRGSSLNVASYKLVLLIRVQMRGAEFWGSSGFTKSCVGGGVFVGEIYWSIGFFYWGGVMSSFQFIVKCSVDMFFFLWYWGGVNGWFVVRLWEIIGKWDGFVRSLNSCLCDG